MKSRMNIVNKNVNGKKWEDWTYIPVGKVLFGLGDMEMFDDCRKNGHDIAEVSRPHFLAMWNRIKPTSFPVMAKIRDHYGLKTEDFLNPNRHLES